MDGQIGKVYFQEANRRRDKASSIRMGTECPDSDSKKGAWMMHRKHMAADGQRNTG
jgi:hypothetical protein